MIAASLLLFFLTREEHCTIPFDFHSTHVRVVNECEFSLEISERIIGQSKFSLENSRQLKQ